MKKKHIIIILSSGLILFLLSVFIIVLAFSSIRPTAERINKNLTEVEFARTVAIPQGIPPPIKGFEETIYYWEMITPEKEVTGIRLKYTPGFSSPEQDLKLVLEMPEKSDPSIFNKVLPVLIVDKKSLESALNPKKADLSKNDEAGYESLKVLITPDTEQAVRIEWLFDKNSLSEEIQKDYSKLSKYPGSILKTLYSLPSIMLQLLSA